jgi:site-specific DNA recombinase
MMKKAVGYVRISTSDQSNWSLDGQEKDLDRYCEKENVELLTVFRDDGQSAKNFDRAEWKELYTFIKKHHKKIDQLLVVAYDRFSRNISEALNMIEQLEMKFSIEVMSITQPIGLHRQNPYFFQFRAQMLMSAELELRVIRDRTKTGMVRAAREGRYIAKAPIGYINSRDSQNKPVISIDVAKAPLVQKVYRLYLEGMTQTQILRAVPELKFRCISSITGMLTNPVYAGLIRVPAYYDEPERIVQGIHKGIIPEGDFWRVQALQNKPQPKFFFNEEVPLRGVLKHNCSKLLTAGNSKGQLKHYWYYVCPDCKQNLSATKLHSQFDEIVKHLSLSKEQIDKVVAIVTRNINEKLSSNTKKIEDSKRELQAVKKKIDSLEGKYISDDIDSASYKNWRVKLETERVVLEDTIKSLNVPASRLWAKFKDKLSTLSDLSTLYNSANIHGKQAFIRIVFDSGLSYSNGIYRTPYILPMFADKALILKQKRLMEIHQPFENLTSGLVSSPCPT